MLCPSCAQEVKAGALYCPHCDHVFEAATGQHLPNASDALEEPTNRAPPPPSPKPPARPVSGQRPSTRGSSGVRPLPANSAKPLPGSQPLAEEDSTEANRAPRPPPGARPPAEEEPTNAAPSSAAMGTPTHEEVSAVSTAQIPALRGEEDSTDQRPALELPDEPEPPPTPRGRSAGRAFAARAARVDATPDEDEGPSTARDMAAAVEGARPKPAAPKPKPGGKFVPPGRGSSITKAVSLGKMDAAAPPPVDPETFFRNLGHTLMALPGAEKIEVGSAVAMATMLFMPWQTTNSRANPDDDTIGLATWGGFWSLLFLGGAMGLFYLRHTGRLPALTPKLLSLGEALLSAITVPLIFFFIVFSIKQHPVKSGLNVVTTRWASLPAFGSILGLICAVGICVGAVMCFQRHRHDPA